MTPKPPCQGLPRPEGAARAAARGVAPVLAGLRGQVHDGGPGPAGLPEAEGGARQVACDPYRYYIYRHHIGIMQIGSLRRAETTMLKPLLRLLKSLVEIHSKDIAEIHGDESLISLIATHDWKFENQPKSGWENS